MTYYNDLSGQPIAGDRIHAIRHLRLPRTRAYQALRDIEDALDWGAAEYTLFAFVAVCGAFYWLPVQTVQA